MIDTMGGGQPTDGFRLGPGFAAQLMIDRHRDELRGRRNAREMVFQQKQQRRGIAAPGNRDDNSLAPLEQALRYGVGKGAQRAAQQAASACSCFTRCLRAAEALG